MVLLTASNRFSASTARCKHLRERLADWCCMMRVHANLHYQALLARLHEVQQERDSLAHQLKISNNRIRQVFSCCKSFETFGLPASRPAVVLICFACTHKRSYRLLVPRMCLKWRQQNLRRWRVENKSPMHMLLRQTTPARQQPAPSAAEHGERRSWSRWNASMSAVANVLL